MQLLLTFLAALAWLRVGSRWRARRLGGILAAGWSVGTIILLIVVWRPNLATRISEIFGIGRGVDAVLYISVALLFYIMLRLFLRIEQQENLITKLVSEIALARHEHEQRSEK